MACHSDSPFSAGDTCPDKRALLTKDDARTDKRRLLCVVVGRLVLALVRATLDALLALFANTVYAAVLNAILHAALTRTGFVTALTCVGTIGTLQAMLE